jgi:7,8-dihydropterin-6-yl-methyl-4-(beta-D-ribofuranosyl)aminobenzene 5'-phosphate synthase
MEPMDQPGKGAVTTDPGSDISATSDVVDGRMIAAKTSQNDAGPLEITILYDNNSYDTRLTAAWGFSALVKYGPSVILFDTGGDGSTLMSNIANLDLDPATVDLIILSHAHSDHIGGLADFLKQADRPEIYLLPSFSPQLKASLSNEAALIEVSPGQSLVDGVMSTGEMGSDIPEQALMIRTRWGYVTITGCAHPGIVKIIERVKDISGEQVYLVVGGFHLRDKSTAEIETIIADFQRLGVKKVAPTHCTGAQAITMFKSAYGDDFIQAGVGRKIQIER